MNIVFAIPTWNRAEKLERCVRTIAGRIAEEAPTASIFVSDNASNDHTPEVLQKLQNEYECLTFVRKNEHGDLFTNMNNLLSQASGDYIWLFGDDDILHVGALQQVNQVLEQHNPEVCCVGNAWFSPHTGMVIQGTLLQIMSRLGFNQSVSFISADIISANVQKKIIELDLLKHYEKDAFAHVASLLHIAADNKALYVDIPAVSPMEAQTQLDLQRWAEAKTEQRYYYFIDSLQQLMDEGIIPRKLPQGFFRYLNFNLWDRFLLQMLSSAVKGAEFVPDGWQYIRRLADMLDNTELSKLIHVSVDAALAMVALHQQAVAQANFTLNELNKLANHINKAVYPNQFFSM